MIGQERRGDGTAKPSVGARPRPPPWSPNQAIIMQLWEAGPHLRIILQQADLLDVIEKGPRVSWHLGELSVRERRHHLGTAGTGVKLSFSSSCRANAHICKCVQGRMRVMGRPWGGFAPSLPHPCVSHIHSPSAPLLCTPPLSAPLRSPPLPSAPLLPTARCPLPPLLSPAALCRAACRAILRSRPPG